MPISLSGSLNLSGSLTTTGTITATTLVVQTITSSISSITGSTNFGSLSSDTHTFTGSINASGSATFSGSIGLGPSTGFPTVGLLNRASDNTLYAVAASSGFTLTDSSLNTMYNATPTSHTFNISNAAKMTITSSGSVGIGTTNPDATLPSGSSTLINNGWKASNAIILSRKIVEINGNDNNGGNVGLFLRQPDKATGLDIWADNYYGNSYIDSRFDNAAGQLSFRLRTASLTNQLTAMNLTSAGVVDLPYGQIKFPATQNASADANTLDDYEEGTWTPTFGGATDPTGVTYDGRSGSYTKVGRLVTVHFIMGFTTYTGGSGALQVRGLPFTCSGETSNGACQLEQLAFAAGRTSASVRVSNGTTSVEPQQFGGTTSWTSYNIGTAFTSSGTGKYVQATVTYTTT